MAIITPELADKIKEYGKTMTAKQIATKLGLHYTTVHNHVRVKGIERRFGKRPGHGKYSKKKVGDTSFFNENERSNWLV